MVPHLSKLLLFCQVVLWVGASFILVPFRTQNPVHRRPSSSSHETNTFSSKHVTVTTTTTISSTTKSEDLMNAINSNPRASDSTLETMIHDLESSYQHPTEEPSGGANEKEAMKTYQDRFEPLIGLYDVSYVKTKRANDNPVGGKWTRQSGMAQKILSTRRTFQHVLPINSTGISPFSSSITASNNNNSSMDGAVLINDVVAEAVNVISLEALFGWIRLTVMLRGDAVALTPEERCNVTRYVSPLSTQAVRVLFDPPRIVVGRTGRFWNVNVGPKTSVTLDTTYCDDRTVRIGMGATSGTRFVFGRCADTDVEANEFRSLLAQKPLAKWKALVTLGMTAAGGILMTLLQQQRRRLWLRIMMGTGGAMVSLVSLLLAGLIGTSGGGIERGDLGVRSRKEDDEAAAAAAASATRSSSPAEAL